MRLRACLVLVILLAAGALPVLAQGDGQSADVVVQHDVEIVFPAAIRFELTLDVAPDEITRVLFMLDQAGTQLVSQPVGIDPDLEELPLVLTVDWPLQASDPPELFSEMMYAWEVLLEDDTAQTVEDTFLFQPGEGSWRVSGDAPLTFAVADSSLNLTGAREAVLPTYALMAEKTGAEPEFRWIVQSRGDTYCPVVEGDDEPTISPENDPDTTYVCDESAAQQILAASGYSVLYRSRAGMLAFQDDVVNAMFASFYGEYWDGRQVQPWFSAGLRRLYQGDPQTFALRQVQEASRVDSLYSAVQLGRGPSDEDLFDLWSAQTYTLVLYLADQFGADAPFALAETVTEQGFNNAFESVTGMEWATYLVEWERWLFTDSALRAADWTVYLAETPTPAPSATPVPPLPTNTVRPSSGSETPTPSATPLNRGVITAQPTFTATSDILPTATNTPRPPGSLDSVNDAPSTTHGASGATGPCPASLPVLVLPGLAVIGIQNRKKQA